MSLILMYITNNLDVALIAQKYGVQRIWVDLETLGKEERQKGLNTVKSKHKISDIAHISPYLDKSEMLVRINPWNNESIQEIDAVIDAGADIIMLPMWKSEQEVKKFIEAVDGRIRTTLLLETKESVECIDKVLEIPGIDEIHKGLNDLHLSYGMMFMFELLSNGVVEALCDKFKKIGIPYGFGGIARIGEGALPAEKIVMEHYRLGSSRVILSRTFCNLEELGTLEEVEKIMKENIYKLRNYENSIINMSEEEFLRNKEDVHSCVEGVKEMIRRRKKSEVEQRSDC